jgi:hypothetical protein
VSSASDFMRRRALVLAALKKSAPTSGGGAPGSSSSPAKPLDARGTQVNNPPVAPRAVPSPVELPAARRDAAPSVTLSRKQLLAEKKRDVRLNGERAAEPPYERPRTRGDCFGGERPCPFVGCKYHTYLDVTPVGSLVINHPDVDPAELKASCSLDIADGGGITLEQVGAVLQRHPRARASAAGSRAEEPRSRSSSRSSGVAARRAARSRAGTCRLPAHGPEVLAPPRARFVQRAWRPRGRPSSPRSSASRTRPGACRSSAIEAAHV